MKLYHGTSAAVARRAPSEGLAPRAVSGVKSNWKIGSTSKMVYLTDTYAMHFAANAAKKDELWGIVELDGDRLDSERFYPDEDFLEQASRGVINGRNMAPPGLSMEQRTAWYRKRLLQYKPMWRDSLKGLGCVGHLGVVPASAVTRVSLYDPRSNPMVTMKAVDGVLTRAGYMVCGDQHRALTEWALGDAVSPERLQIGWQLLPEAERERMAEQMNNTSGIQVIYTRS